jgi:hypothetical protein
MRHKPSQRVPRMKKTLLFLILAIFPGCAWYKDCPATPDTFGLTDYRASGQPVKHDTIGIELDWSLKP